ncbi:MAG: MFS transporter [Solirubrobacteraceae bacterium]
MVPLLPTYAADFDLSKTGAGILAAAYAAGTFLAALPGGRLAARIGVRRTVVVGLSTLIVASLAFAFAPNIVVLDLARFVQGLGGAASWAGAIGWLIGAAPRELIGSAMAAAIVGALGGPVLGGLAATVGPEVVFSGVAAVAAGLLVWAARTPEPAAGPRSSLRMVRAALRDPRVATAMWRVGLVGLMFGTLDVLAPLRLDALGAGAATIAATFLVAAGLEAAPCVGTLWSPYAVVPRGHPLAGGDEIELSGLRDDPWVQGASSTSPGLIRELCRAAGFEPRIAFESDDPLAARGIVAAGLAVSLIPSLTKDDTARDRHVRVLPLRDPPRRHGVAATMAGGRTTQATAGMVAALARAGARIGRSSH